MSLSWIIPNFTSVAALVIAGLSYRLSKKTQEELKSDERVIPGKLDHPRLGNWEHEKCVIMCRLFNKSKRKVFVNSVKAYDQNNNLMKISWSDQIDPYGGPQKPHELIGIVDNADLYVRENMGKEIDYCRLEVSHSFSSEPLTIIFDPVSEFSEN